MAIRNRCTFDFTGAAVLVTGGTSGIGYAIAAAFADAGAQVTVTGTRPDPSAYDDVELSRFTYHQLDVRDADAIDALAGSFDLLDVLVNNAGQSYPFGVDEWTPDGFSVSLDVNLKSVMRLSVGCHGALRASEMPGGACVVNVLSMAAFRGKPMVLGYSSAKAGVLALTRNLALQWLDDGIRVNAIAPGLILTRMTAPLPHLPEIFEREMARVPSPRMGTPEECAAAALFLATEASAYTTGTSFAVDGGYLAF